MLMRGQHYMTPVRQLEIRGNRVRLWKDAQDLESMSINIRVATCPSFLFLNVLVPDVAVWGQSEA